MAFDTGTGFNGIIESFEIFEDGLVMVAGNFNQYNGEFINGVARLNSLYGQLMLFDGAIGYSISKQSFIFFYVRFIYNWVI